MAISQYDNEYYGLSGDVKPLGTPLNGRKFTEMDTSKEYRYDAENQQWLQQSGGGGGGSGTLSGLTDVDISNPTDGQTLVYNATSGKWENGAGGGGGALIVHQSYDEEHGLYILDKTWQELYDAIQVGPVLLVTEDETNEDGFSSSLLQSVSMDAGSYWVNFENGTFNADSANGYLYYQAD